MLPSRSVRASKLRDVHTERDRQTGKSRKWHAMCTTQTRRGAMDWALAGSDPSRERVRLMMDEIRLLVALDDSEASQRAVAYVAAMVGGRRDVRVRLFHVLPHLPPAMLEWGGSAEPTREKADLEEGKTRFFQKSREEAQPALDAAAAVLRAAGVPQEAIEKELYPSVATTDLAGVILDVAKRDRFDTIVVGRGSWSWLKKAFRHHLCHEIIMNGERITVWVVE